MYKQGLKRRSSFAIMRRIRSRVAPMLYKPAPKLASSDRAMLAGFFADDVRKLQTSSVATCRRGWGRYIRVSFSCIRF